MSVERKLRGEITRL